MCFFKRLLMSAALFPPTVLLVPQNFSSGAGILVPLTIHKLWHQLFKC